MMKARCLLQYTTMAQLKACMINGMLLFVILVAGYPGQVFSQGGLRLPSLTYGVTGGLTLMNTVGLSAIRINPVLHLI